MTDKLEELRGIRDTLQEFGGDDHEQQLLDWAVSRIDELEAERKRFFEWANLHPPEQTEQMPLDVFASTRLVRVWEFNEKCDELARAKESLAAAQEQLRGLEADRLYLGGLLAVIHRDGGQYVEANGWRKSVDDAIQKWCRQVVERDRLRERLKAIARTISAQDQEADLEELLEGIRHIASSPLMKGTD